VHPSVTDAKEPGTLLGNARVTTVEAVVAATEVVVVAVGECAVEAATTIPAVSSVPIVATSATRADISLVIAVKLTGVTSVINLVTLLVTALNQAVAGIPIRILVEAVTTVTNPGTLLANAPPEAAAVVVVAAAVARETATTATNPATWPETVTNRIAGRRAKIRTRGA